ncbi:MAG: SMC-Scp complex subunit ScpB [Aeoliella sp.]
MSNATNPTDETTTNSPLSLKRLANAFAAMLGHKPSDAEIASAESPREVETSTRSITEALLFVGRADNQPLSAEELAATMRDVSPAEVATTVTQLNAEYADEGSPYTITESAAGFRMVLREEFKRVRDKFYGKVRQSKISPAAMEVLSVVAYRQPATAREIDELRGGKSHALVSGLVRRGLLRLERPADDPKQPHYVTTDRFLRVFKLTSINQLPQAEEFESANP